ncbi:GFA family protein [Snodgrassella alvi]|uniref:GFA family protein n=1 Tax=Snodgrassella alvi TaxID=1196083 RepID=UPI0034606153
MANHTASCLCGKITFSLELENYSMSACHCHTCRQWNAGPLMTIMHTGKIHFHNKELITHYQSSEWAERAFCSACGTHLYYRLKHSGQYYIAAWIFKPPLPLDFNLQVYIDNKPDCYTFANQTHNMTEADILQMIEDKN